MKKVLLKYKYLFLGLIIAIAILLRFWLVSGNNFVFLFDQARDVYLSNQIFANHKLKIQGPSASGTGDKVYHGVLYYYIIGPVIALSKGDPFPVLLELIIINVLTIIPMFLLTRELTKNSLAASFLSVIFFAFSYFLSEFSLFISNQVYSLPASTLFYYAVWKVFFDNKPRWILVAALSLGIAVQAGIYMLYLCMALVLAQVISRHFNYSSDILKRKRLVAAAVLIFLAGISSIIVSELLLFYRGVVHVGDFMRLSDTSGDIFKSLQIITQNFVNNFSLSILPTKLLLSFVACAVFVFLAFRLFPKKVNLFLGIVFVSPLLLLLLQVRDGQSYIVSITPMVYILVAGVMVAAWGRFYGSRVAVVVFVALMFFSNFSALASDKAKGVNYFSIQQEVTLNDELELIDYTYQAAGGKPFTISTMTNPFGFNTTWGYLYSWYGRERYGYMPDFYGAPQSGIFGSELMQEAKYPGDIHFAIYESPIGIDGIFISSFRKDQDGSVGSASAIVKFRGLTVERR